MTQKTVSSWINEHPEFRDAINYAKAKADRFNGILPQYVQIMQCMADGKTVSQAADVVNMAPCSVHNSLAIVRREMGYNTTLACVAEAMRRGWVV